MNNFFTSVAQIAKDNDNKFSATRGLLFGSFWLLVWAVYQTFTTDPLLLTDELGNITKVVYPEYQESIIKELVYLIVGVTAAMASNKFAKAYERRGPDLDNEGEQ